MIANRRAKAELARGGTGEILPDLPDHDLMGISGSDDFQAQYGAAGSPPSAGAFELTCSPGNSYVDGLVAGTHSLRAKQAADARRKERQMAAKGTKQTDIAERARAYQEREQQTLNMFREMAKSHKLGPPANPPGSS